MGGPRPGFNGHDGETPSPPEAAGLSDSKSPPVPEPEEPRESEEHGGPKGKEPTRYGDWESKGIAWDF